MLGALALLGEDEEPDVERLGSTIIADVYTFGPKDTV